MRVAIAADHAGLPLRAKVAEVVKNSGHEPILLGPDSGDPVDYPVIAKLVADALNAAQADRGILLCGSGAGVTVAANKLPGIRAAMAQDSYTAKQMVEDDMVNVLTMGGRVIGPEVAAEVTEAFLSASFSGLERHRRRLGEVLTFERERNMNALTQLHNAGQSIWLDNIRRALLTSGTLAKYISDLSITGLTSNPTIFEHAIGGSNDYDEAITKRLSKKLSTQDLFFELALEDIIAAADLFRPVYESTNGVDGFVSLEVSPKLANDTKGTIEAAKKLHKAANRPNVFIKVPGTKEGLPAIEELIASGIPVNVTLLFSTDHYLAAAEAYLKGLERRIKAGQKPDIASVASLFISRWDAHTGDKLPDALRNQLGIAVAKKTFRAYQELLASKRWQDLAKEGANPQRLLWASTGTKDPSLPDTYYITALASKQTVNTMPEATLLAFGDHGQVKDLLSAKGEGADETLALVKKAGVNAEDLASKLQIEGRDKFDESFKKLLDCIEKKVKELHEARDQEKEKLGPVKEAADKAFNELVKLNAPKRIWADDYTLWSNDPSEISNRLGWLVSPSEMAAQVEDLKQFTQQAIKDGFTHVIWSGMGGSSLFPQVLQQAFGEQKGGLNLKVLDTSDPGTVNRFAKEVPLPKTLFLFASKSGGTIETRSHLDFFWELVKKPNQFAVVTDAGTDLDKLAVSRGFRRVFRNNPNIGGRYSALSHFGLVPAALLGIDVAELLNRTGYMEAACAPCVPAEQNPALRFGAVLGAAAKAGRDKCTLFMPEAISSFAEWLEQLIAESTGKHGTGILPIAGEDIGNPSVYGNDRIFVSIGKTKGVDALEAKGHPVVHLEYVDPMSIGAEVFRWEFAIASAGKVLGINPFDQPNVEAAKKAAGKVLSEGLPDIQVVSVESALKDVKPGNYIAIQAYIDTESPQIPKLQKVRMKLRDQFHVATTVGIGPRYLHSTGQFHKGGPAEGIFLQIVGEDPIDVQIPGKPYSFSKLKHAQAAGDYMALVENKMRVARVSMEDLLNYGQIETAGVKKGKV